MAVRGIRGAISVTSNTKEDMLSATRELLEVIADRNGLVLEDVASVLFTVTDDLDAEFPAVAARAMGWGGIPLFCAREIPVRGSLPMCVRVLIHVNTGKTQSEMVHAYLREAQKLRPDISRQ